MTETTKKYVKTVAAGCFHYPKIAKAEFEKWLEFIAVFQPEKIYLLGSLIHSTHALRPLNETKLAKALEGLKADLGKFREAVLKRIRKAVPNTEVIYLEGPTEYNLRQWCSKQGLSFDSEVLEGLKLDDLKINYVRSGRVKVGKFLFTHGRHVYKEAVTSAKMELKKNGISGCSCVSHHISSHFRTDYRGEMVWHEIGAICKEGAKDPKHSSMNPFIEKGFLVGYFSRNGHYFHAFPLRLDKEIVVKRGKKKFVFFDPELTSTRSHEKQVKVSCMHVPYEHRKSLKSFLNFLQWFKPKTLYLTGDFLDLPQLSSFKDAKDPRVQAAFPAHIKRAKKVLQLIRKALPEETTIYYLEGNHESRLGAYLMEKVPVFLHYKALKIPELLDLKALRIRWIPERGGHKEYHHLTIHGDFVRQQSGETAHAELEKKGISGDSGHTHRCGKYCKTDEQGTREWNEIGCLSRYDLSWGNGRKANWQRGFAISFVDRGKKRKQVQTIIVPLVNGKVCFTGKEFTPQGWQELGK